MLTEPITYFRASVTTLARIFHQLSAAAGEIENELIVVPALDFAAELRGTLV